MDETTSAVPHVNCYGDKLAANSGLPWKQDEHSEL